MRKLPLLVTIFLFANLTYGQTAKNYFILFIDSSSGGELYGYKTIHGEIKIPARYGYSYTDTFSTMAIVYKRYVTIDINGQYGEWIGIDTNENIILSPYIFDNGPDYVEDGLFRFIENGKIGFANLKGEKIIPASFDFANPFSEGLTAYAIGGKRHYRKNDETGENWYWVGAYEKGLVNKSGQRFKKVSELKGKFREAWTQKGIHVLLDAHGKIIKTLASQQKYSK